MIVEQAFLEMYPEKKLGTYSFSLKYSGKFNDYNANLHRLGNNIQFNLSKKWKSINNDVKIGLIQELFNSLFKTKIKTQNIELYNIFLKKVHIAVPKIHTDTELEASFSRVNETYFNGTMEQPNLKWGSKTFRKLGSYEYGSDTIMMSTILKEETELLDYVMYHEMLHKKHKFVTKNGRSYHHTKAFLAEERKYKNFDQMERKISSLIKKKRLSLD